MRRSACCFSSTTPVRPFWSARWASAFSAQRAPVLTGLLFSRPGGDGRPVEPKAGEPFAAAFPAAVRQAVSAVLTVCGFVVCFSVLLGLLESWGLFPPLGIRTQERRALVCGLFEIGSAVGAMRGLDPSPAHLALAAAVLGWGGLSVHCQTAALFADSEHQSRHRIYC